MLRLTQNEPREKQATATPAAHDERAAASVLPDGNFVRIVHSGRILPAQQGAKPESVATLASFLSSETPRGGDPELRKLILEKLAPEMRALEKAVNQAKTGPAGVKELKKIDMEAPEARFFKSPEGVSAIGCSIWLISMNGMALFGSVPPVQGLAIAAGSLIATIASVKAVNRNLFLPQRLGPEILRALNRLNTRLTALKEEENEPFLGLEFARKMACPEFEQLKESGHIMRGLIELGLNNTEQVKGYMCTADALVEVSKLNNERLTEGLTCHVAEFLQGPAGELRKFISDSPHKDIQRCHGISDEGCQTFLSAMEALDEYMKIKNVDPLETTEFTDKQYPYYMGHFYAYRDLKNLETRADALQEVYSERAVKGILRDARKLKSRIGQLSKSDYTVGDLVEPVEKLEKGLAAIQKIPGQSEIEETIREANAYIQDPSKPGKMSRQAKNACSKMDNALTIFNSKEACAILGYSEDYAAAQVERIKRSNLWQAARK